MMKIKIIGCCLAAVVGVCVNAAENLAAWDPRMAENSAVVDTNGVKWIDGRLLPIEGRWTLGDTANYYCRLPDTLTTNVNKGVRGMRHHTAGMQFRFHTSSKVLQLKYTSRSHDYNGGGNLSGVGKSGWDIYGYNINRARWEFITSSHNSSQVVGDKNARVKKVLSRGMTEFTIYLPLYDGVESFALGIEKEATIVAPMPRKSGVTKPVVFYGTSITHGASASRPGLAFVNQVGRDLDVPIMNLGFSGSGVMEYELSDVIARVDASCYVLDCLWNMSLDEGNRAVTKNYEPFIRNLRAKRPNVPIIMAGQCDVYYQRGPNPKECWMKGLYDRLIAEGWKNLYYLPNAKMHHDDVEGTIDGCHPNDWGMKSMAEAYGGAVKTALSVKK